jgi:hypothetical protein
MKAKWNNELIAESDNTIIVENNHYFPFDAVSKDFLKPSSYIQLVHGKGLLHIIPLLLTVKKILMQHGFILTLNLPRKYKRLHSVLERCFCE